MKTLLIYTLCVIAVFSVVVKVGTPLAYASGVNYVPLAPIDVPGSEFTSKTFSQNSECKAPTCLPKYLRTIYNIGIAMAGLFAVFSIVRGGFTLIFTDSILGHSEAKGIILRALGGLVIVYSSYIFMNQISPSLGRELDLSLNFDRITIREDLSTLSVVNSELTAQQLQKLSDSTDARRKILNDKISDYSEQLKTKTGDLGKLGTPTDTDDEKIVIQRLVLQKEIKELEDQLIEANLEWAHNEARLVSLKGINATTEAAAKEVLSNATKAGGTVEGVRSKFTAARAAMASDPVQIANSYYSEFEEISVINKNLALGIFEHPPTTTFTDPGVGSVSGPDIVALHAEIATRINEIEQERKKQWLNIINLNAGTTLSAVQKKGVYERVNALANRQICDIKSQCKVKGYKDCATYAPTVSCAY